MGSRKGKEERFSPVEFEALEFQGQQYIFINPITKTRLTGAIATVEQYEEGQTSYAHLYEDGRILRYGEVIGYASDIKWLDRKVAVAAKRTAPMNLLDDMFGVFMSRGAVEFND